MRHDYDLPPEWASMSASERDQWFHVERAYRQARRQRTAGAAHLESVSRRQRRRVASQPGVVSVDDCR